MIRTKHLFVAVVATLVVGISASVFTFSTRTQALPATVHEALPTNESPTTYRVIPQERVQNTGEREAFISRVRNALDTGAETSVAPEAPAPVADVAATTPVVEEPPVVPAEESIPATTVTTPITTSTELPIATETTFATQTPSATSQPAP